MGAVFVGAACALAGSCGGVKKSDARDASVDASYDAGADVNACVNAIDAATLCCSETVAEACRKGGCILKWPGDPRAFCSSMFFFSVRDCDGYHVVRDQDIDVGSSSYYDIQSGDLVAVDNLNDCEGPRHFTRPQCSAAWIGFDCYDAGSDASDGAADTGGTDAGSD